MLGELDLSQALRFAGLGPYNQLVTLKDAANRIVMSNFYRNRTVAGVVIAPGPLMGMTDGNSLSTTFTYDPMTGEVASIKDPAGAESKMEYDAQGRRIADVDALGRRTTYVNDAMGRPLSQTTTDVDATGSTITLTTRFEYDANGNVTKTIAPDGSFTTTEYDGNGKPVKECANDRCTMTEYDDRGNVVKVTQPDGAFTTTTFDANGNTLTSTDALGKTTRYVYDKANRLIETILPDDDANDENNPRQQNVYDDAGQLIESIDANGNRTTYGYDEAGRRTHTTLPPVGAAIAATFVTEYDETGRRTASTDADGSRTEYRYDAGGRLIETIFDDGESMKTEYDNAGRKTADIDPMNRRTEYRYDTLGRLTHVILAAGTPSATVTTYTYDARGNKLTQTDAEGRTTRWEYDVMGREIARILPNTERETKAYNLRGELESSTDFNGETTKYVYDTAGRLKTLDYPQDADVTFGYDARGQSTSAIDGRGTSTSTYDAQGRIVRSYDADGFAIEYTYDKAGNMLTRVSASQSLVYSYDARNRMVSVTRTIDGEAPSVTTYEYDQDGSRKAMVAGGIRTEYGYDSRNRLRTLIKKTAAGVFMLGMTYTVDASGMRTSVEETDANGITRSVTWQYDALKRLTREAIDHRNDANDRVSSWTYDDVGNRLNQVTTVGSASTATATTVTYNYDVNDRLLVETADASETRYTYDDNGNVLTKTSGGDVVEYAYDDANRLVELRKSDERVNYVYNVDGLRVRQTGTPVNDTATTTYFVQDSTYVYAQVIEEWTRLGGDAKTLSATYIFADDLVAQTRCADSAPTTSFVQMDGLGSTRWLTNGSGVITGEVDYDAFGVEVNRVGQADVKHLYRGEMFDRELKMYYLRARWMDPATGRFVQLDAYTGRNDDPSSLHKYVYTNGEPVNGSDPSGYSTLLETSEASNIQSMLFSLAIRGERIMRMYDKFNSLRDLVLGVDQLIRFAEGNAVDWKSSLPGRGQRPNFQEAADQFARMSREALAAGLLNWTKGYIETLPGARLSAYVVYMPTFGPLKSKLVNTGAKINDIPIKLGFGAPGGKFGSLMGLGLVMGGERALSRMDYDPDGRNAGHGGAAGVKTKSGELALIRKDPYHMHVYDWHRSGPR